MTSPSPAPPTQLIMFAGLAGAGKSAVADELGRCTGLAVLSVDPTESAMHRAGIDSGQPVGLAAYVVVESVAEATLRLGQSAIVDAVNSAPEARAAWREVAVRTGSELRAIEVICSDEVEHERRLVSRRRDLPGATEPAWAALDQHRADLAAWTDERLVLDTVLPLEQNVSRARAWLGR